MKTFYYNGTILTMEDASLYAEAVCVENGRILAVGSFDDVMQYKKDGDQMIDLKGKTMLPGFIDAHSHFVGAANAMTQCDLSGCGSFAEIIDTMKAFAQKRKLTEDSWIIGCNYDQNFLKEKRHPDRYGMVAKPLFQLLKYASSNGLLKLDVVGYADIMTAADLPEEERDYANRYKDHFKLGGYKVFLDGSPQGRTAWMSEPYEGDNAYCGYPIHTDEALRGYIELALEKKQQLLAHCNGDAAAEQYITQFERVLAETGTTNLHRAVMVHAQLVRKDQLQRMAAIGMIPSFFVAHTYYWGDIHLQNFGERRGSRISPVKDAIDLGMKYTFHQDTPVIPPDMMRTVWSAVNRISRAGRTIYAAYQYFEEQEKGSIACGKYADFVVLDQNPLEVPKEQLDQIKVRMTIKENEVIYRNGETDHE